MKGHGDEVVLKTREQEEVGDGLQFANIGDLRMENGALLPEVKIAYKTYGRLNAKKDNAVLICHALTGNAHVCGTTERPGWWDGLVGPEKWLDTDEYFVICSNVLGGCNGSTGPASIPPGEDRPYGLRFPTVTIRDMVRAQKALLDQLGIQHLRCVLGGSMGGMQVLEWGILYPDFMDCLIPMATAARFTPMAIAYNHVAREAIMNDPAWQGGDYYPGPGPTKGLAIARAIGMISYRTAELFEERFGRRLQQTDPPQRELDFHSTYAVESYLRYQGEKLVRRFDANSYLYLLKAMDTHDICRDRGSLAEVLSAIEAEVLIIGVEEDLLYEVSHLRNLYQMLKSLYKKAKMLTFSSPFGHDAFLVETDLIGPIVRQVLKQGV